MDALYQIDLHLFDGEGGGAGAPAAAQGGEAQEPQQVLYGTEAMEDSGEPKQQPQKETAKKPTFDEMMRDEDYRKEYEARVKAQIDRRFKANQPSLDRLRALEPAIALLAQQYGVNPEDAAALSQAIQDDEDLYEDEAAEKGIPVEQLKRIKQLERENQRLAQAAQQQQRQQDAERIYKGWMDQSKVVKQVYPAFDFDSETQNENFVKLLKSGVDVKTAFEVVHKDDIIGGAMQYTAQQVAQKVASDIRARGNRPTENGAGSSASSVIRKPHASDLTTEEVLELAKRAKRGHKTQFG